MNNYFINITSNLNIQNIPQEQVIGDADEIDSIVQSFRFHPSIKQIKRRCSDSHTKMSFDNVSVDKMLKCVMSLKTNKTCPEDDISAKLLKEFADIYVPKLQEAFNNGCSSGIFPDPLKMSDVSPLFKAEERTSKENYRPVSKLPNFSKVFERLMHDQIFKFMKEYLSPRVSGFRKGYSTQHALLSLVSSIQKSLDKNEHVAALLMDLSKAFKS